MVELGGKETAYEYDGIKRLTNATTTLDDQANTQVRRFQYTYDRHSNLTSEQATGTTPGVENGTLWSAFSPGDQICASIRAATDPGLSCTTGTTGETTFTHDGAGNMTEATGGPTGSLGGLDLAYNLPGQTGSITAPGATNGEAQEYDGVMQDRRTTSGETTMSYGYAGLNKQTTTGLTPSTEIFVRDPAGKLMAMITNTAADEARYYLTDDQKTVIATTDQDTDNVIRYLYEPYGQTVRSWEDPDAGDADNDGIIDDGAETLTGFPTPTGDRNPFGYISGYTEEDTGLIKFGTRYYIPTYGTWTQPDPQNGSVDNPVALNAFIYSHSNPANRADSSGRFPDWGGGIEGSACFGICTNLGFGYDGDPDFTFGFSVGPKVGISGGPYGQLGSSEGHSVGVNCTAAFPLGGVDGGVSYGGSVSGTVGARWGGEGGCAAGWTYTL